MSRWESWAFGTLHAVLATTGVVYFVMKYLLQTDDPFAVVNHPWQPAVLATHVLAAPLGMLVFGVVFRSHILKKLTTTNGEGRRSGWIVLISFATMALSGYLLQVVTSPTWLRVAIVTHVVTSVVFVVGYSTHLVVGLWATRALRLTNADRATASPPSLTT